MFPVHKDWLLCLLPSSGHQSLNCEENPRRSQGGPLPRKGWETGIGGDTGMRTLGMVEDLVHVGLQGRWWPYYQDQQPTLIYEALKENTRLPHRSELEHMT